MVVRVHPGDFRENRADLSEIGPDGATRTCELGPLGSVSVSVALAAGRLWLFSSTHPCHAPFSIEAREVPDLAPER